MNRYWAAAALAIALGCRPDDQETGSIEAADVRGARSDVSPEVAMHLDSGNAAYRAGDYPGALRHYRAIVRADDKHAAGWFGIYMAQLALGNAPAADSALKRAQKRARGATLIHPKPAEP
ncbi:MAG: hypothetical protein HY527_08765 [Betaproteobacteria bacterium]|nr:hypothetical protein [Betaproteobacteria bacterium]